MPILYFIICDVYVDELLAAKFISMMGCCTAFQKPKWKL
jgi:hypothetical protein